MYKPSSYLPASSCFFLLLPASSCFFLFPPLSSSFLLFPPLSSSFLLSRYIGNEMHLKDVGSKIVEIELSAVLSKGKEAETIVYIKAAFGPYVSCLKVLSAP
jgi:hypothetical protein